MELTFPEMLFFGAVKQAGHYLWRSGGFSASRAFEKALPFHFHFLDAGMLPEGVPQVEGAAGYCMINGWTVVSFWDRSVDSRMGSNSAFIYPDERSFEEMIAISNVQLPWFWSRVKFEVVRTY